MIKANDFWESRSDQAKKAREEWAMFDACEACSSQILNNLDVFVRNFDLAKD